MSLQSAIERMTVGDDSGVTELVDLMTPRLKRWAKTDLCKYAPDLMNSDLEDIAQDVWLQFLVECRTGRFKYQCDAATCVYLRTKVSREIRTRFGRGRMLARPRATESLPESDSQSLPPDAEAALQEIDRIVQAALNELPDKYREVIMLRDFEELGWKEIASSSTPSKVAKNRQEVAELEAELEALRRGTPMPSEEIEVNAAKHHRLIKDGGTSEVRSRHQRARKRLREILVRKVSEDDCGGGGWI